MNNSLIRRASRLLAILALVLPSVMLVGCSDSGPSNQNPSGLYKSGTGTIGTTGFSDMVGLVHNNRIMAFSVTARVLIDGTITSVNETSYNATVRVYKDGAMVQSDVSVSGMVRHGSSISGNLEGTGNGSGDFSLTFDPLYNRGATNARINSEDQPYEGSVVAIVPGLLANNFTVYSTNYADGNFYTSGPSTVCFHDGQIVIPNASINIYQLSEKIDGSLGGTPCSTDLFAIDYTGFAAVTDGSVADNTLLYAITNATYAVFGVWVKQPY